MARESFRLDGAAELDAQLAQLGTAMATEIGREAAETSAEVLRDAWVAGAPYSERASTMKYWSLAGGGTGKANYGHLKGNIKVAPVKAQKINAVVYKVTTGDAFWGYFLEFGTVRMPPHPWARPIVERMKAELINVQIDIINDGIQAVTGARVTGAGFGPVLANGRNA